MEIGKILFPVTTLGPGSRLGIWVQGCNRFCRGCSNPELQIFDPTKDISVEDIFEATLPYPFDGVTISGGEPFLQSEALARLIKLYRQAGYEDILVYTGFTMQELVDNKDDDIDYILANIAVLVDGPFVADLVDNTPLRGSSNQTIWILNKKYSAEYQTILSGEKEVDIFRSGDEVHFIGIPFAGYDSLYKKLLTIRRPK